MSAVGAVAVTAAQPSINCAETAHGTSFYNDYDTCRYLMPQICPQLTLRQHMPISGTSMHGS